jgi:hypothetical protein
MNAYTVVTKNMRRVAGRRQLLHHSCQSTGSDITNNLALEATNYTFKKASAPSCPGQGRQLVTRFDDLAILVSK